MKNTLPKVRLVAVLLGLGVLAGCSSMPGAGGSEMDRLKAQVANAQQSADAAKTAADQALSKANAADSKADQALSTANDAKQTADRTHDEMNRMFKKYQRK